MFSLTVLEVCCPEPRCGRGALPEPPRDPSVTFQLLAVPAAPGVSGRGRVTPISASASQGLSRPCIRLPPQDSRRIGLGPTRLQSDLFLTYILITSAETLFPNKVTFVGTASSDFNSSFWGRISTHNTQDPLGEENSFPMGIEQYTLVPGAQLR